MKYEEPLFRPPAEADSLIFQVAYGCPHNSCLFCLMYKGVPYKIRNLDELSREVVKAGRSYPETKRVFLADGDVMNLDYNYLSKILRLLNENFPNLARVNVYANGSSIVAKSSEQLLKLKELKLNTLYLGLETGDDELLKLVMKSEDVNTMVESVLLAQSCGLRCSVMVLLGLGGRKMSLAHSEKTSSVLNRMQPRLLSFLRFIEFPQTNPPWRIGGYEPVSEYGAVQELYRMIEGLELKRTVVRANHSSNPVPLEGRFPQDKARLLGEIENMLSSGRLDRKGRGKIPFWL